MTTLFEFYVSKEYYSVFLNMFSMTCVTDKNWKHSRKNNTKRHEKILSDWLFLTTEDSISCEAESLGGHIFNFQVIMYWITGEGNLLQVYWFQNRSESVLPRCSFHSIIFKNFSKESWYYLSHMDEKGEIG